MWKIFFHIYSTLPKFLRNFASGIKLLYTMAKREHKKLNAGKNFRLPEEIIDGYELYAKKGNRKVTLIGRPLPNGNVALVRYSYDSESRRKTQQSTGVVLFPETNSDIKNLNRQKVDLEKATCEKLNTELMQQGAGFTPVRRRRMLLTDFIRQRVKEHPTTSDHVAKALINHLDIFHYGARLTDVNEKFVEDFVFYLRDEAIDPHFKDKDKSHKLKPNTQANLLTKLSVMLNAAVKKDLIKYNPVSKLDKALRPKVENHNRTYLSKAELERLASTPFPVDSNKDYGKNVPKAFFFSVYTGLRFSDIVRLTGANFGTDDNGMYISFNVKKTTRRQQLYIGDEAKKLLPANMKPNEPVFKIPENGTTNVDLQKWAKAAGITKNLTFHVARHTNATMLLNNGVPIEAVSFQLGHKSVSTTQIYAEITSRTQRKAARTLDNALGDINLNFDDDKEAGK